MSTTMRARNISKGWRDCGGSASALAGNGCAMRGPRQWATCPYYHIFAHKTHEPSTLLAEKVISLAPEGLRHVFFTNSGGEANDSAIKFVWYYNNALGRTEKKKFISRQSAYHGIPIAAGSLTGLQANQRGFDLPLPFAKHVSAPHYYRNGLPGESEEAFTERLPPPPRGPTLAHSPPPGARPHPD